MARHGRGFVYKAIVLGAVAAAVAPPVEEHIETVRPRVIAGEQPSVPTGRATRWNGRPDVSAATSYYYNQLLGYGHGV